METELHSSVVNYRRSERKEVVFVRLPKLFSRQVFTRLKGGETFVITVKYGCFHSKTEEFKVDWEASVTLQESASPSATYLVPPATMPPKNQGA
jgi:hypothetical protein